MFATLCLLQIVSCGTLIPGANYPKTESAALIDPQQTRLGGQVAGLSRDDAGTSGFRILTAGVDGLLTRVQMIDAAERTLDLQYYIFRGDQTGRLLTDALLRAADRGVRVRVLVDDGGRRKGDEQIMAISGHAAIEVRIFNPFAYRGHARLVRGLEFAFNAARVDYRMHNKLLVVDNTAALIGGRNIGNEYFQMDPASQLADDDIFVAGPVARRLSVTFDEFWRNDLSIPAEALGRKNGQESALAKRRNSARARPVTIAQTAASDGIDYVTRIATGEPFAGMVAGRLPLVWAHAQVISDSPDKRKVASGDRTGRRMAPIAAATASSAQTELLMVTPYFIPADEDLQILTNLRLRQVSVRILTNSLESAPELTAHAHYVHFRVPLLEAGVELHEIRALLGNARGSGQTARLSRYGNYALHAKLTVIDRQKLLIGSMNYDQRSRHINTEIAVIVDSAALAQQTVARFEAMVQPVNAYALALQPRHAGGRAALVWRTEENGVVVVYRREPARNWWHRFQVRLLAMLPIESEL